MANVMIYKIALGVVALFWGFVIALGMASAETAKDWLRSIADCLSLVVVIGGSYWNMWRTDRALERDDGCTIEATLEDAQLEKLEDVIFGFDPWNEEGRPIDLHFKPLSQEEVDKVNAIALEKGLPIIGQRESDLRKLLTPIPPKDLFIEGGVIKAREPRQDGEVERRKEAC